MRVTHNSGSHAIRFIRKLRGASQPILVRANDDLLYVVKFLDNPIGPNTLFNESAGSELFRCFSLPTPPWKPLLVTSAFLDRNPGSWFECNGAPVRPQAGLCFASLYLGGPTSRLFEILPRAWFSLVGNRMSFWWAWIVDALAHHLDRRQAVFAEAAPEKLTAWFIDHGHLFGGPNGPDTLPPGRSRYLDSRIYPAPDEKELHAFLSTIRTSRPEELRSRVQSIPEDWKTASAQKNFDRCLDDLASSARLTNVVDEMLSFAGPPPGLGSIFLARDSRLTL